MPVKSCNKLTRFEFEYESESSKTTYNLVYVGSSEGEEISITDEEGTEVNFDFSMLCEIVDLIRATKKTQSNLNIPSPTVQDFSTESEVDRTQKHVSEIMSNFDPSSPEFESPGIMKGLNGLEVVGEQEEINIEDLDEEISLDDDEETTIKTTKSGGHNVVVANQTPEEELKKIAEERKKTQPKKPGAKKIKKIAESEPNEDDEVINL